MIESLLACLTALAVPVSAPEPVLFKHLIQRYRFTVNEQMQLKNQLSRWNVVTKHQSLEFDETRLDNGKDVLRWLDIQINSTDFYL